MTSSRLGVLVCALVLTFSTKLAGQTISAPKDPQSAALANAALAALTGVVQISDITLTGTATQTAGSDIETGSVTLKALGTANSRMDLILSANSRSEIRNADGGSPQGAWTGPDSVSHAMADYNCMTDAVWFFPTLGALTQTANANFAFTYVDQETLNGQNVVHLQAYQVLPSVPSRFAGVVQHRTQMDVYLDATSLLPAATSFYVHSDNDANVDILVQIRFSNYQQVGGALVPFHIQKYINNGLFLDLQFQTATLNTGLSASAFALP